MLKKKGRYKELIFNRQQQEAIDSINGNISVIASAGSGKTTMLTHRIKNMTENYGISSSSILAVTFSRKAKDNISNKLEELGIGGVHVETFHSLALKIIFSAYGTDKFQVWTAQWEREKIIGDICVSLHLCSSDDVSYNDIFSFIALQKVNMRKPTEILVYPDELPFEQKDMQAVYVAYEKEKEQRGYIEFDDFLNMANEVFDTDPETAKMYRNLFQYVLVDEFQDISLSQSLLLKKINMCNTMIVGDPLQAIYGFRGGNSNYILNFDEEYQNVKVINLNTNYRCSKDIVTVANSLALSIPDSKHKNYVESIADKDNYKLPELRHFHDDYEEGIWAAQKITELQREGYQYNNIAILARTNAQLQKLETILHKSGIAFDIVDGKVFTDLPEVRLVLSYLRLAEDIDDDEAFQYLYNKPNRWLNKKFFEETEKNSQQKNVSLYHSMLTIRRRNWRFKNGINEIVEVISYLQNRKYETVAELVHYLRKRLNIDTYVSKGKQADDGNYTEQIENLDSFENMCQKYDSIKQLLDDLNDLNQEIETHQEDKVKLLTIHKSKGMEYPVVFIIGCNDGLLPHYKSKNPDDERRLLYVAVTRAEKELYLSYVDMYNGQTMERSSFVENMTGTIKVIDNE